MLSTASLVLVDGVADRAAPKSYRELLSRFETKHFAVVTGDEDNTFRPE
ncbi:MAG: hypothetical protein FJ095_01720 [Deltaproteobacteria bacterium]|nr:hypothetical protein [Deltaproteobacteria bacterium]